MRDQQLPPPEPPDPPRSGDPDPRRLATTGPSPLAAALTVGLVVGWLVRPVCVWLGATPPRPGPVQVGLVFLVAAILGWVAWATFVAVHRRRLPIPPHQAVNRLVLAKACAIVGSGLTGAHLGSALSWVGVGSEVAGARIAAALAGALGSVLVVATALLLERACRVREDEPEP